MGQVHWWVFDEERVRLMRFEMSDQVGLMLEGFLGRENRYAAWLVLCQRLEGLRRQASGPC